MNRVRLLLLTAYLVIVVVGGVIYVQSVSNMILYTEADQKFPSGMSLNAVKIPAYSGERDYSVNCSFRFENQARVPIILRAFSFEIAIDTGAPGNPYEEGRLMSENIGRGAESLGTGGPIIDPGETIIRTYVLLVSADDSARLNHVNVNGNYTVVFYSMPVAYGYAGTTLLRQFWPGYITVEVAPVG